MTGCIFFYFNAVNTDKFMQIKVGELDMLLNAYNSPFYCGNALGSVKYDISTTISIIKVWNKSMIIIPAIDDTL